MHQNEIDLDSYRELAEIDSSGFLLSKDVTAADGKKIRLIPKQTSLSLLNANCG